MLGMNTHSLSLLTIPLKTPGRKLRRSGKVHTLHARGIKHALEAASGTVSTPSVHRVNLYYSH